MLKIESAIKESAIYRLIMWFICQARSSWFFNATFSPRIYTGGFQYKGSFTYRLLTLLGKLLDKAALPISKKWDQSFSKSLSLSAYNLLLESKVGAFLAKFRFVYILVLFPAVDYAMRYLVLGGKFGGIWDEAFYLLLVLVILFRRFAKGIRWRLTDLDFPVLFYISICLLLLILRSPDPVVALDGFRVVVQYMLWFFLVVQLVDSEDDIKRMLYLGLTMAFFVGMHAAYQYITKAPMLGNWVDSTETITSRAYSILLSPNLLGSFFTLFIPLAFALFIAEDMVYKKVLALAAFGICSLGLLFTLSRGAWLAAFVGIIVFLVFTYRRILLPIIVFTGAAVVSVPALSDRFFRLFTSDYVQKSSTGGRIFRFQAGLEQWQKDPIFGVGLGRFGGAVAMNYNLAPFYMDNYYMKTLVEMGVVGLTATAILYLLLIVFCVASIRSISSVKMQITLYGALSGIVGVLVHNFMENIFESPAMVSLVWVFAAIVVSARRIDDNLNFNR